MKKFILFLFLLPIITLCYAEKIKIVYTANTYSSLYPCGVCPSSVGGGVSRRATLIKELRNEDKDLLLIEGGNFLSSSDLDISSINFSLDKKRTLFYIDALNFMGYDVLALGENDFNFGIDFLKEIMQKSKFKFVSSNLPLKNVLPYYIKKVKNINIGILSLTPIKANKKTEINIGDYSITLKNQLNELKNKVDFIILILPLDDQEIYNIVDEFKDIKLVLAGLSMFGKSSYEKRNETFIVRPSYLGRDLVVLDLDIKENKILDFKYDKKNISKDIKEDTDVLKIIPSCFKDSDCPTKTDLISRCQNPAELSSICSYYSAKKYDIFVITDKNCSFCSTKFTEDFIKENIIGANFLFLDYKEPKAKDIIEKYKVDTLPFFLFPKDIKEERNFDKISKFLEEVDTGFYAKKDIAGIFMFLNRKRIEKKLDFFLDFYGKNAKEIFKEVTNFIKKNNINFNVYFVMPNDNKTLKEEIKLAIAIKKLYPNKFLDYINKRLEKIDDIYWIDILDELGVDYKKIKNFVKLKDMDSLLNDNINVSKELNINSGNVILVNNNKIFKIFEFNYEEFKKIFSS